MAVTAHVKYAMYVNYAAFEGEEQTQIAQQTAELVAEGGSMEVTQIMEEDMSDLDHGNIFDGTTLHH